MKILSWNLERPKKNQTTKTEKIKSLIHSADPDIIVLTESNLCLDFGEKYFSLHTSALPSIYENQNYSEGENRVSIYSNFPFKEQISTYDSYTTVCGLFETPFGEINIYGSIIGGFGGRGSHFESDLQQQKKDLINMKGNICFSGDFNITFSGWKYPSAKVIDETKEFFNKQNLEILTKDIKDSAIHTAINKDFLSGKIYRSKVIEIDKKISDHNLIICEIFNKNQH